MFLGRGGACSEKRRFSEQEHHPQDVLSIIKRKQINIQNNFVFVGISCPENPRLSEQEANPHNKDIFLGVLALKNEVFQNKKPSNAYQTL